MIKNSLRFLQFPIILLFVFITLSSFFQDNFLSKNGLVNPQENPGSHLLSDALKKLESDFGISFMFDPEIIKNKRVEKPLIKGKVEQQLIAMLTPLNLSFKKIHKNYYVIQAVDKE